MKLKREAHALYIRSTSESEWYLVGKDISDLSVDMNGSFESNKNILGESSTTDNGYTPQIGVDPYKANTDDSIYAFLRDLALNRKSGDDAKIEILEVMIENTAASSHAAWKEDGIIEIVNYGGDTTGMAINFNIHYDGNREEGTATIVDKVPTFKKAGEL